MNQIQDQNLIVLTSYPPIIRFVMRRKLLALNRADFVRHDHGLIPTEHNFWKRLITSSRDIQTSISSGVIVCGNTISGTARLPKTLITVFYHPKI